MLDKYVLHFNLIGMVVFCEAQKPKSGACEKLPVRPILQRFPLATLQTSIGLESTLFLSAIHFHGNLAQFLTQACRFLPAVIELSP